MGIPRPIPLRRHWLRPQYGIHVDPSRTQHTVPLNYNVPCQMSIYQLTHHTTKYHTISCYIIIYYNIPLDTMPVFSQYKINIIFIYSTVYYGYTVLATTIVLP